MVWQRRSNGLATWIERFGKADDEWHSQIQVIRRVIRRLTSGHLSAAADSKTSPRNPVVRNVYCALFGECCQPRLDIKL